MVVRNKEDENSKTISDMEARDADFPKAIPSEEHPQWMRVSRPYTANNKKVDLELLISKLREEGNSTNWRQFIEMEGASETELSNQVFFSFVFFIIFKTISILNV